MEAGESPAAQIARQGQAKQVIEFVSQHSPSDHAVILMGDFNMGPFRPGKSWQSYRPNHYASEEDMKSRTAAFETMKNGLLLRDAADELHRKTDDGIERLLFRSGSRCQIVVLASLSIPSDSGDPITLRSVTETLLWSSSPYAMKTGSRNRPSFSSESRQSNGKASFFQSRVRSDVGDCRFAILP